MLALRLKTVVVVRHWFDDETDGFTPVEFNMGAVTNADHPEVGVEYDISVRPSIQGLYCWSNSHVPEPVGISIINNPLLYNLLHIGTIINTKELRPKYAIITSGESNP